jgi:hypothetical protein
MNAAYLKAWLHINRLVGPTTLIHSYYVSDDVGPGGSIHSERLEGSSSVWTLMVKDAPQHKPSPSDILALRTIGDVTMRLADILSGSGRSAAPGMVETEEQFNARKAQELNIEA